MRLAAFQNPAFYTARAMRRSTHGTPCVVACAELLSHHIAIPRGCLSALEHLLEEFGVGLDPQDERFAGHPVETTFLGELTPEQAEAVDALLAHDTSVLAATTAFGKTVVAASLLAARKTNTLAGKQGRRVVSAFVATAFAQDDADGARAQWRLVADQLRPKALKLAALMDEAEDDVLAYMTFPKEHRQKLHSTDEMDKRFLRWRGRIPGARTTSRRRAAPRLQAPPSCLIRALPG